jgi:hypothetical protein
MDVLGKASEIKYNVSNIGVVLPRKLSPNAVKEILKPCGLPQLLTAL